MTQTHHAYLVDSGRRRVSDDVTRKTKICSYFGENFVAERGEDGSLSIFVISDEALPAVKVIGDARRPARVSAGGLSTFVSDGRSSRMTPALLQARNEARFPRHPRA